jgi:signal transduction histidine kinase
MNSNHSPNASRQKASAHTPYKFVLMLIAAIFAAEVMVMALISELPDMPPAMEWLFDASCLVLLVLPVIYRFSYAPMRKEMIASQQARQRLELYAGHVDETSRQVQSFAYTVAHDLRVPLVNIKGFAKELLLLAKDLIKAMEQSGATAICCESKRFQTIVKEEIPEAAGFVSTAADSMDSRLNTILQVARLGCRELKTAPTSLQDVATAVISRFSEHLREKGIVVSFSLLPTVNTDRLAVEQILTELVDNSIKFTAGGKEGMLEIRGREEASQLILEVTDNGCGIPFDDQEKIFEIFRKSGEGIFPGEGIGLAKVRMLIRRLGGRIWCQSTPGKGTTFTACIPLNGEILPVS